jgi:uncharacterized membrane protein
VAVLRADLAPSSRTAAKWRVLSNPAQPMLSGEIMYSKAKLLGHPVHPMLVGFPVAFYTATLASYGAYAATGDHFWFQLGVVANLAGVVGAAFAAVPGFIDWAMGIPSGHPAKAVGLEHLLLNVTALLLFGIDAYLQYGQWSDPTPSSGVAIALAAVGMGLTVAAGFLGWNMVQKHHVGIDLTADQPRIDIVQAGRDSRPSRASQPAPHRA